MSVVNENGSEPELPKEDYHPGAILYEVRVLFNADLRRWFRKADADGFHFLNVFSSRRD